MNLTPGTSPNYVVGIGASAGGLEALEGLFTDMPTDTGMAFVVVQHLSPDFESLMDELIARYTTMPVRRVEDGMPVEENTIYVIPPKKEMIISGGKLLLTEKDPAADLSMPIDIFLRSLGEDWADHSIGIILSGTGSDGSRGIVGIHEAGGLVLVQRPDTAKFDGMPRTAEDSGVADFIVEPKEMGEILSRVGDHVSLNAFMSEGAGHFHGKKTGMQEVLRILREEFGIDFSHYKPNTVARRVERRVLLLRETSLPAYIERLQTDRAELDSLYRDLLIGVTRFFRDTDAFKRIEEIMPKLIERLAPGEELRLWVAACATGEEAYSLAIVAVEAFERLGREVNLKVFATDVHQSSLEFASAARYPADRIEGMSGQRLARFFVEEGDAYRVSQELRQLIVYAQHNLIKDAPFTRIHLISCRNLLIYLQPAMQRRVISLFHFGLVRDGILFLGSSETPVAYRDDFLVEDERWRVFRKHRDVRLGDLRVSVREHPSPLPIPRELRDVSIGGLVGVYDALLQRYMPASFLVSTTKKLLHTFGGAGRYLRVADGRPTGDLLDLINPELRIPLTGALQRVAADMAPLSYKGDDVAIEVHPVEDRRTRTVHLLVTIQPLEGEARAAPPPRLEIGDFNRGEIDRLEADLRYHKENLQATIEELETSNEELQATNEEMLASNEELQSTNEELQSVNEELYTVNAEFQRKIAELTTLTNDMDNLLESTEVGTIFLDRELCIRKFTPKIAETFSLLPQDIGRSIGSFTHNVLYDSLLDETRAVLQTEQPCEREVCDRDGRWWFLRLLPYRAKGAVAGVVLTLVDISSLKAAENELFRERYLLSNLMDSVPDLIAFKDTRGRFVRINRALADSLGLSSPDQARGRSEAEIDDADYAAESLLEDKQIMETGEPIIGKLQHRHWRSGKEAWFLTTKFPLFDAGGKSAVGTFGIHHNITRQKLAEEQAIDAVRRRDEFLAMLSHELRNPLSAITTASAMLQSAGTLESKHHFALDVIRRQSGQMARLLDDLLDISRIVQNKIELQKSVIDLKSVLEEVISAVRHVFSEYQVELDVRSHDGELWLEGDPVRIQQVILNLLVNAAKYSSPRGHAQLELKRDGNQVVIAVRDDGVGIAPEMKEKIFEPFVQSDVTLARSQGGMGLGLTLVRSIVELHGGAVSVESEGPGRGAVFEVRLPTVTVVARRQPADAERSAVLEEAIAIVLVEDRADIRETLRMLLEAHGCQVETASDGEEGVSLIVQRKPRIALVDIGLPKVDGYEVARRVRELLGQDTRLVALTGYGQQQDRASALAAGFDEHLVKPVQPEVLTALLRRSVTGNA